MGLYVSLPRCLDLHSDVATILATKTEFNGKSQPVDRDQNERFPDLAELPPELGLAVLSHLNATDLCLAGCVWNDLAHDEILWMGYVICIHIAKYVVCSMKIQHLKNLSRLDIFDSKLQSNEEQYQNIVQKSMGIFINLPQPWETIEIIQKNLSST